MPRRGDDQWLHCWMAWYSSLGDDGVLFIGVVFEEAVVVVVVVVVCFVVLGGVGSVVG